MIPLKKKEKPNDFVDDGRVIANMNIDGMPRSTVKRSSFDEFGRKKEKKETIRLSGKERRSVFGGVVAAQLLFGVIIFGGGALFLLFCTKVWFK